MMLACRCSELKLLRATLGAKLKLKEQKMKIAQVENVNPVKTVRSFVVLRSREYSNKVKEYTL